MCDYMVEGTCKFCGQVQVLKCSDNLTGAAADEWITERCKCPEAQNMRALHAIAGSVDEVLGNSAVDQGFEPVDERTIDLVTEICRAAYSGLCGKVTLAMPCGDKLAIAPHMMPDGIVFVTIKRQQKKELGR